ncbi:transposase [Egibacter rhizosphaerae]|uniref:transposase n=1 Tax=Egibacter rhizosphaerae TaxID=1670831 RepID=UPI0023EA58EB|nr:transposase [Egibacter rhizosphaerae]
MAGGPAALRLVTEMGMTPAQAAQDLGCSAQAIRDWRRQAEIDAGEREGLSSDERERLQTENTELKRRNEQLEQEREILNERPPTSPQCQAEGRLGAFARYFAAPPGGWWFVLDLRRFEPGRLGWLDGSTTRS